MGTWGTGPFADDLACEVRDGYRDLLAEGHSAEEVKGAVLRHWAEVREDVDAGPVFWLALAVTQWRLGRLDQETRNRALRLIDSGEALRPWQHDARLSREREAVLSQVHRQLSSPQPPPRKPRKRFRDNCEWEPGELIRYRLRSGKFVVFRVTGHHTDRGGTSPVVEILDWVGDSLPSLLELGDCQVRKGRTVEGIGPIPAWTLTQVFIGRLSRKEFPADRVERLGAKLPPTQKPSGFLGASWSTLDEGLLDNFGLE